MSKNVLDIKKQALQQTLMRLPLICGNLAVNFFKTRFRAQGWYDRGFEPWQPRKATKNKGRAILTKTRRLERSIRIIQLTRDTSTIGTDAPYARVHNEGFRGTVTVRAFSRNRYVRQRVVVTTRSGKQRNQTATRAAGATTVRSHTRQMNMPRRQYMGDSAYLRQIEERKIVTEILKAFK